jgi:predicted outer membrane repeat protein
LSPNQPIGLIQWACSDLNIIFLPIIQNSNQTMKPIFLTLLLLPFIDSNAQNTIFVNLNVQAGQQNGNTWADAFPDLQQALSASNYGDEIWVAQGTYFPTTTTDRSISFVLKNGVKIYGGFQGSETSQVQRDFESNQTILSGNIGLPNGSDNSYHVVYGEGLDSTTILDGFVVTKGVSVGVADGGGLLIEPSTSVYNTCPIIQNCRFEANYATVGGGVAIYRWSASQNYANPIIRNCQFVSNRATLFGGGMAKIGPAIVDQPFVLENCTFSRNSSKTDGGGIFFSRTENTTILKHCVFEQDTSSFSLGGGVYFASGYEEFTGAILKLDSCTFKENRATEGGGLYYYDGGLPSFSIPPFHATLSDCIFEGNVATNGYGGGFGFIGVNKSALTIDLRACSGILFGSQEYSL